MLKKQSMMTLIVATALTVTPFVAGSQANAAADQGKSSTLCNYTWNTSLNIPDSWLKQWLPIDLKLPFSPGQAQEDQQASKPEVPSEEVEVTTPELPQQETEVTTPQTPQTPQTPSQPETTPTVTKDQAAFASRVVELVNQERAKGGLAPLKMDDKLSQVAMIKAKDMYDNHYFDHQSPTYGSPFDLMRAQGVSYSYAGENIAKGQTSPEQVMQDWMNSDGHRKNIMNPNYTSIGVAYYNGEWVQEFTG